MKRRSPSDALAESVEDFRKRLNQRALEEDEERPGATSDSSDWFLGEQARNRDSVHSDIWTPVAVEAGVGEGRQPPAVPFPRSTVHSLERPLIP